MSKGKNIQADGSSKKSKFHKIIKKCKIRLERRKAKLNPDCFPTYKKYFGYEL